MSYITIPISVDYDIDLWDYHDQIMEFALECLERSPGSYTHQVCIGGLLRFVKEWLDDANTDNAIEFITVLMEFMVTQFEDYPNCYGSEDMTALNAALKRLLSTIEKMHPVAC